MISKTHIGRQFAPFHVDVEAGRLRFFAKAIGETNPLYVDLKSAQSAGYANIPAPPTFLFSLELEGCDPMQWLIEFGAEPARILHGEQSFEYFAPVCAGDRLTFNASITDIYDKKNGAMTFIQRQTHVTNQQGQHVANINATLVHRNG